MKLPISCLHNRSHLNQGTIRFALLVLLAATQVGFASGEGVFFGSVSGVAGVDAFDDVKVILTGPGLLETAALDAQGHFAFYGLADGDYIVKVRKPGFKSSPSQPFRIERGALASAVSNEFALEQLGPDAFVFHWEEDQSTAGYEYAANVAAPLEVEILGEQVPIHSGSAANLLVRDYNIKLVDSDSVPWTHEHAYRLLQTMATIPQRREQDLLESHWLIARTHVQDDIQITGNGDGPSLNFSYP